MAKGKGLAMLLGVEPKGSGDDEEDMSNSDPEAGEETDQDEKDAAQDLCDALGLKDANVDEVHVALKRFVMACTENYPDKDEA